MHILWVPCGYIINVSAPRMSMMHIRNIRNGLNWNKN